MVGRDVQTAEEKLDARRAYAKKWRAKNAAKMRVYFRRYYAANRDAMRARWNRDKDRWTAQQRIYRATAKAKASRQAWRDANREKLRTERRARAKRDHVKELENSRRSRAKHRERKRAKDRIYRHQKRELCKASIARSRAKNTDLYKTIAINRAQRRRARLKSAVVERVSLKRIETRDRSLCHLCQLPVERSQRSFDHLIPVVRGGAYAEWNLMVAHLSCNQRRGARPILPEETKDAAIAYIEARIARQETAA